MSNEEDKTVGLDDLSQMFAPSWARQDPGETIAPGVRFAHDDDRGDRPPRRDGRDDHRGPRRDRDDRQDGRPPRRNRDDRQGGRPPRREGFEGQGPRREGRPDRPPRRDDRRPAMPPPPPPPLAIDVRFMPDSKALASIVRRIQTTHRAYPVRDIVKLFQKDDASMAVRIEARNEAGGPDRIFQCRTCGMPSLSEAEVAEHLLKKHMADYFDIEEVECDPPAGNFPCVARCGLTGELLGPPNHHSFARRVQEMVADRFQAMGEEEYRRHIEMVRDPEVVEEWRNQCRTKLVYRLKKAAPAASARPAQIPDSKSQISQEQSAQDSQEQPVEVQEQLAEEPKSPALDRHDAELLFRREILPGQIGAATHVVCPATSLRNLPDRRLAAELSARFADEADRRFPQRRQEDGATPNRLQRNGSLFAAIHAAFHHRGLFFFRAGDERGQEFVMASQPVQFDLTHATSELREIAQYVADNPSCPPKLLVEALNPDGDEDKTRKILSNVKWLVEKGYLIEFFNGFLSPPARNPIFKPNPPTKQKRAAPEAQAESATESAESTETTEMAKDAPAETPPVAADGAEDAVTASACPVVSEESPTPEAPATAPETAPAEAATTPEEEKSNEQ